MYKILPVSVWKNYFNDLGLPSEVVTSYIAYVEKLASNNYPVIFESEHLSLLMGVKRNTLLNMVNSPTSFYRTFEIPKRNGGIRKISAPYPSLLLCQRWIYENILSGVKVHKSAHGYAPKRSIVTNAKHHVNKKCLLKMDIKDFFPSIPFNWVINLFASFGYSKNVAFFLASLCCMNAALPQGAATSPCLTNILLYRLDIRLSSLAKKYDITYTRYADDLFFSSDYIPFTFSAIVKEIIHDFGLEVNDKKTKLKVGKGQKIVTGISVSGERITLPRKYKRDLKKDIYYIRRYGLISHMSKMKIRNPYYLDVLLGKLMFWSYVEPSNLKVSEDILFVKSLMIN